MRITNSTLSTNYLRNLNRNLELMQKYQNQLSSGKEVSKPSDNPLLVSKIMDLNNNILQNEQYNKNISDTLGWVNTQDGALKGATDTLNRVRDLIIYGANGSLSETDSAAIKDEVVMKIQELADILNTNFDGRYIFAGQKTTKMPFSVVDNTLTYNANGTPGDGSEKDISREISKGVTIDLLTNGSDITTADTAVNKDLGALLNNIVKALDGVDGLGTENLSGELLSDIDIHLDNVLRVRSKIGAIYNRLEASEDRNKSENINLNSLLSQREDIDIAEKYMEYSVMKTVYQASLATGAQILQPSLLDYLRWIFWNPDFPHRHPERSRGISGFKKQRSTFMKINTKYLGEIDIKEEDIIQFPNGLLGFEDSKEFILLSIPDNPHFKFLQDIKNRYISFLLVNPWDFFKDYDVELPDEELLKIDIDANIENSMEIYTAVTIGQSFQTSTSNLLAPIVINLSAKKGRQFILNDSIYNTKHKLFPEGKVV